jgi:hypothetical protein
VATTEDELDEVVFTLEELPTLDLLLEEVVATELEDTGQPFTTP